MWQAVTAAADGVPPIIQAIAQPTATVEMSEEEECLNDLLGDNEQVWWSAYATLTAHENRVELRSEPRHPLEALPSACATYIFAAHMPRTLPTDT